MKNFKLDSKYTKISLYVIFVLFCYILLDRTIENLSGVSEWFKNTTDTITALLQPFIYGLFIAYFLNAPMRNIETRLYGKIKFFDNKPKVKRTSAVITTYMFLIGVIYWLIAYLLPEVASSFGTLIAAVKNLNENISNMKLPFSNEEIMETFEFINSTFGINLNIGDIISLVLQPMFMLFDNIPQLATNLFSGTINTANLVLNIVLGLVIGVYMLCDKEHFSRIITKFLYVVFPEKWVEKITVLARDSNKIFEGFFVGKVIDSTIIGLLFFITCQLTVKPSYVLLLSVIIGVTNMIPYFGPFIGAVPVLFIVIINSPIDAVWVGVIILALQQLDGIVIGPKILGDSTGVKPIGVIFAILIGGAVAGPLGMFLGVPVFAVIRNVGVMIVDKLYEDKMKKNSTQNK